MTDGTPELPQIDDDTLLDMVDHAHEVEDEQCDAIVAETSRSVEDLTAEADAGTLMIDNFGSIAP